MAKMLGGNTFIGLASQSDWDTAANATEQIRILSETLGYEKVMEFDPSLRGSIHRQEPYVGKSKVSGDITCRLGFEGFERVLYHLFGSGNAPTGTGPYTWTFTCASDLPTGGMTIHKSNYNIKKWKYRSCKVKSGEFRFGAGMPCEATFGFLGRDVSTEASADPSTLGFPTYLPILASYGSLEIDSTERCSLIKSAVVRVENALDEDAYTVCSSNLTEPDRTDLVRISGELTTWVDSNIIADLHDNFLADTAVKIELIYTGGTIPTHGGNYTLTITLPECHITPTGDPQTSGGGIVEATWPFEVWDNESDEPITIELINGVSAL